MAKEVSLIELAKLAASRHDERRKYEWKISFAFWGLIVGAMVGDWHINTGFIPEWTVAVVLAVLYSFLWLRGVWVANVNDKSLSDHFRKEAEAVIKNPDHQITDSPKMIPCWSKKWCFGFLFNWAMLFHLVVTVFLTALYIAA